MSVRTLHLTNAYHPSSGGIRTFYRALLTAAEDRQRELVLVVPGASDDLERVGQYGRIYSIEAPASPLFDTRYRLILPSAYLHVSRSRLARILEEVRPDVVEVCDKYGLFYLAAMLRKGWLPRVPRPTLIGLSCERMDDNIAAFVNQSRLPRTLTRVYIRHLYGPLRLPCRQLGVHGRGAAAGAMGPRSGLHPGVPDGGWMPPSSVLIVATDGSEESCWNGGRPRIERVAVLRRPALTRKNLGLLVDALEQLLRAASVFPARDYRLILAGDGPKARDLVEDAGRRVSGRVLWLGSLGDRAHLARAYASADVFVHPNPREPFGIGPLEAMASGVPVVLPRAGGVLSYANDQNSWLARPDASFVCRSDRGRSEAT